MLDSANNRCYNIGVKKKGRAMRQGSGKGRKPIPGSEAMDPLRDPGHEASGRFYRGGKLMLVPSIFNGNLFDDFMDFSFPDIDRELYGKRAQNIMKTDVKELDNGYEVMVDLPGFNKEDIHLELTDGNLTISAVKSLDKENESKGNYIRRERVVGNMQRSFYVGKALTEEDIHAKYENGILTLDIPKKDARKVPEKKYISID